MHEEYFYCGNFIYLKLVELSDANKILDLRLNQNLNKYLSTTPADIKLQEKWILQYKERERNGLEYYFSVIDKEYNFIGTIRIYEINYALKKFTIGSWIIKKGCDPRASLESILAAEFYGYNILNLEYNYFDVRKKNKMVINFHNSRNAEIISEDEQNKYFLLKKNNFNEYLYKISRILTIKHKYYRSFE